MIPQSTIDNFKRDPLGSVTAMVNDPKSILKNVNIQIPDSVKSIADIVPQSIKDKIVPRELQELVSASPSTTTTTVQRIETDTSPHPPASMRKIDILPPPPICRVITPEPIAEEQKSVKVEDVTGVIIEDGGIVTKKKEKEEEKIPSTILKIDPADLEAVQALLNSRNAAHVVLQSNSGSTTAEARL
jgi:hypothetical protein